MHLLAIVTLLARWRAQPAEPETCWHCKHPVQDTTAGTLCGHCGADQVPF
jgi:hypothetical protein